MVEPIVTVSGVRGIVGESLTPDIALKYARGFGTLLEGGTVVLGRDTRPSGPMIQSAALSGLLSTGCNVIDLDIVSTPTLQLAIKHWKAAGGCVITASHNPVEWNALKFFQPSGMYLDRNGVAGLNEVVRSGNFNQHQWDQLGEVLTDDSAVARHIERVLEHVNVDRIRSRKFHVAVDCVNGAACGITPVLLERLGCKATLLNAEPTGIFAHPPEPITENLSELCDLVRESNVDIGFAQDADVDRLAIVADGGKPLGEEMTLVLVTNHVLSKERGTVVTNLSTTTAVDAIAHKYGCVVERAPVGDANVSEKLRTSAGIIGGEGNGGVIFPKIQHARDAVTGMALLLDFMATQDEPMSEIVEQLPKPHIVKRSVRVEGLDIPELLAAFQKSFPCDNVRDDDGIRHDWDDHWIHIRASGTEPILRIIAESSSANDAAELCDTIISTLIKVE